MAPRGDPFNQRRKHEHVKKRDVNDAWKTSEPGLIVAPDKTVLTNKLVQIVMCKLKEKSATKSTEKGEEKQTMDPLKLVVVVRNNLRAQEVYGMIDKERLLTNTVIKLTDTSTQEVLICNKFDVVIATLNFFEHCLDKSHVKLSDFPLILFDECLHRSKKDPYKKIRHEYLRLKLQKKRKSNTSVPKIIGLTSKIFLDNVLDDNSILRQLQTLCAMWDSMGIQYIKTDDFKISQLKTLQFPELEELIKNLMEELEKQLQSIAESYVACSKVGSVIKLTDTSTQEVLICNKFDVVIATLNFFEHCLDKSHVKLSDFPLILFDECLHRSKKDPYKKIRHEYLRLKLQKKRKSNTSVPKIIGLTSKIFLDNVLDDNSILRQLQTLCAMWDSMGIQYIKTDDFKISQLKTLQFPELEELIKNLMEELEKQLQSIAESYVACSKVGSVIKLTDTSTQEVLICNKFDVVIATLNFFEHCLDKSHVKLSDFPLILFDECLHRSKKDPYKKIRHEYLRLKLQKKRKSNTSVPKIIGLTSKIFLDNVLDDNSILRQLQTLCAMWDSMGIQYIKTDDFKISQLKTLQFPELEELIKNLMEELEKQLQSIAESYVACSKVGSVIKLTDTSTQEVLICNKFDVVIATLNFFEHCLDKSHVKLSDFPLILFDECLHRSKKDPYKKIRHEYLRLKLQKKRKSNTSVPKVIKLTDTSTQEVLICNKFDVVIATLNFFEHCLDKSHVKLSDFPLILFDECLHRSKKDPYKKIRHEYLRLKLQKKRKSNTSVPKVIKLTDTSTQEVLICNKFDVVIATLNFFEHCLDKSHVKLSDFPLILFDECLHRSKKDPYKKIRHEYLRLKLQKKRKSNTSVPKVIKLTDTSTQEVLICNKFDVVIATLNFFEHCLDKSHVKLSDFPLILFDECLHRSKKDPYKKIRHEYLRLKLQKKRKSNTSVPKVIKLTDTSTQEVLICNKFDVVIATLNFFEHCLDKSHVKLSDFLLILFDECLHRSKKDPYKKIRHEYLRLKLQKKENQTHQCLSRGFRTVKAKRKLKAADLNLFRGYPSHVIKLTDTSTQEVLICNKFDVVIATLNFFEHCLDKSHVKLSDFPLILFDECLHRSKKDPYKKIRHEYLRLKLQKKRKSNTSVPKVIKLTDTSTQEVLICNKFDVVIATLNFFEHCLDKSHVKLSDFPLILFDECLHRSKKDPYKKIRHEYLRLKLQKKRKSNTSVPKTIYEEKWLGLTKCLDDILELIGWTKILCTVWNRKVFMLHCMEQESVYAALYGTGKCLCCTVWNRKVFMLHCMEQESVYAALYGTGKCLCCTVWNRKVEVFMLHCMEQESVYAALYGTGKWKCLCCTVWNWKVEVFMLHCMEQESGSVYAALCSFRFVSPLWGISIFFPHPMFSAKLQVKTEVFVVYILVRVSSL
ncbi:hypothetical protein Btru_026228 [Bulinus truncatus]|nr:hypothetical protein Btru_026228 [Bulinus truncatus]